MADISVTSDEGNQNSQDVDLVGLLTTNNKFVDYSSFVINNVCISANNLFIVTNRVNIFATILLIVLFVKLTEPHERSKPLRWCSSSSTCHS